VQLWEERIEADEVAVVSGMRVTTAARTALDLAGRYPLGAAVAAVDALVRATELKMADVGLLADRYRGRRGMKAARAALALVDGGAQSQSGPGFHGPRRRSRSATNGVGPKRIWTWDGRTSRSQSRMRVSITS
jgi:hypothetical protein